MSAPQFRPWSSKNEALYIGERPDDAKWCMAVVEGEASSNELIALVWGYSPEGVSGRAQKIAAAQELYDALDILADACVREVLDDTHIATARHALAKAVQQ